jgi:hypothetical protein
MTFFFDFEELIKKVNDPESLKDIVAEFKKLPDPQMGLMSLMIGGIGAILIKKGVCTTEEISGVMNVIQLVMIKIVREIAKDDTAT